MDLSISAILFVPPRWVLILTTGRILSAGPFKTSDFQEGIGLRLRCQVAVNSKCTNLAQYFFDYVGRLEASIINQRWRSGCRSWLV